jgi:hypothetical protein
MGNAPAPGLSRAQVQALKTMSSSERQKVLKRCNSISSDSYDEGLVSLCRLLRTTASR